MSVERAQGTRPARSGAVLISTLLISVVFAAAAQAAPGDLDLTFSGDGKQTTDFGHFTDVAGGVALAPYGKIVAVGETGTSGYDFALARYNPNGSLDPTFSGDGKETTNFGGGVGVDVGTAVAMQSNGKIIAVGRGGPRADFAIARYNPNGSLDTSFSGDGKQTTDFGTGDDTANAVAIQSNGKIVVAGGVAGRFALARFNPDGSLDTTFSGDGKRMTDWTQFNDVANGVAIQTDSKIVAVGAGGVNGGNFALARFNPDGSLDTSFAGDGRQQTDIGPTDIANGVALQGNGKIVLAGGDGANLALARYNSNGLLDRTFSGDGKQTTSFSGESTAAGVALDGSGKIVAAGQATGGAGSQSADFALARFNPDGSLDTSFSGDGKQTTDFGLDFDGAHGVALQTDGKIVLGGYGGPGGDFALARYLGG